MRATRTILLLLSLVLTASTLTAQDKKGLFIADQIEAQADVAPQVYDILGPATCAEGRANGFPCGQVNLASFMGIFRLSPGASGNDIWGWRDPETNKEYALMGLSDGIIIVEVTDPNNPSVVGHLATYTSNSSWRDVKVYANHMFVVSEANDHGLQIFDLTELRNAGSGPEAFQTTAHFNGFGDAHNIAINEETGFAYVVGAQTCAGGLHMINIQDPTQPVDAGCYAGDGYTHDAQCVIYNGPDTEHQGKEICIASNEDTVTIVDVSDKENPVQLGRLGYPDSGYIHQGWLTDDHTYFYQNDELDERSGATGTTRTAIWDLADLDDPQIATFYTANNPSIDHNLYIVGNLMYQANYTSGLRILNIADRENPIELAHFDVFPEHDNAVFTGAWSVYPFFESGTVVVSSIDRGLFILNPQVSQDQGVPVEELNPELPKGYTLSAAYPNPFNPQTTFTLELAEAQPVTIAVYNTLGQQVATLHQGPLAGQTVHTFRFDAGDLPSGTYLLRVTGASFQTARTVALVK